jgi:hypothetical protein
MASHGADAFRTLACAYRDLAPPKPDKKPEPLRGFERATVDEWIAATSPNGCGFEMTDGRSISRGRSMTNKKSLSRVVPSSTEALFGERPPLTRQADHDG